MMRIATLIGAALIVSGCATARTPRDVKVAEVEGEWVYICPMHLDKRKEKPGCCEKCTMIMVPAKNSKYKAPKTEEKK